MKPIQQFIVPMLVLSGMTIFSCESDTEPKLSGDYFPLEESRQWQYLRSVADGEVDSPTPGADTLTLTIGAELELDGKIYREILGEEGRVVRVDGSKYFGRRHELYFSDTTEYVFLDTDKEAGESWFYLKNDGATKTEYVIEAKNTSVSINGKQYQNVIKVRVNYYAANEQGTFEYLNSAFHYYAAGTGEIYRFYPDMIFGNDVTDFILEKN
jgi:hypothetical protein